MQKSQLEANHAKCQIEWRCVIQKNFTMRKMSIVREVVNHLQEEFGVDVSEESYRHTPIVILS